MVLNYACERCSRVYRPIDELGMHNCRTHPGKLSWTSTYSCCNTQQEPYWYRKNEGCTLADHVNSNIPIPVVADVTEYTVLLEQTCINLEDFAKRPGVYRHTNGNWYVSTIAKHN